MAMFDKHKSSKQTSTRTPEPAGAPRAPTMGGGAEPSSSPAAMIGQGIRIVGEISADTNLRVDGEIQGRLVQSTQGVEVGESGHIVATIQAKIVKIGGEVNGDVAGTEKVIITRTGRVQGNLAAPRVVLEDGALFRGSIEMNPAPAAEAAKAPAKPAAKPAASAEKAKPVASAGGKATAAGSRKEPGLTLKSG
jgi:cytoskeletal protein CcmA (bactofilin family)